MFTDEVEIERCRVVVEKKMDQGLKRRVVVGKGGLVETRWKGRTRRRWGFEVEEIVGVEERGGERAWGYGEDELVKGGIW